MADSITIKCAYCGKLIKDVPHIPGEQIIQCPGENHNNKVVITKEGHLYVSPNQDWWGCHITKVVCYAMNLSDDCRQLTQLRRFRDEYLNKAGYSSEVEDYYKNSEKYAGKIAQKAKDNPELYLQYFNQFITPAVKSIEKNEMKEAHSILRKYLSLVKEL